MRDPVKSLNHSGWFSVALVLASSGLVVGVLYFARAVLIPIALAVLLTFVMAPIVTGLRRGGLGRTGSVIVTVTLMVALLGGFAAVILWQLQGLANALPGYRENISRKISDLRLASRGGSLEKVQETVTGVLQQVQQERRAEALDSGALPVVVRDGSLAKWNVPVLGPLLRPLATAGLVVVLVIFMSLRREDLRDRLLRLVGYAWLAPTTKAIDEAGKRVSRYLLRQFLLNTAFGVLVGVGLFLIGLPYASLWGVLAGVARFVPYAGPILSAVAPILMSLAVFDGWTAPLLVIGLVTVLELLNNMLLEPWIYGQSIGVSEVALLVMIAFWTLLWGPTGLVLAAPLTVCLMVISKEVPDLEFIALLLSSEPALAPHHVFYQRLVAQDSDEAEEIAETFLKDHSRAELFDQVLVPALIACRRDYQRERLTAGDRQLALQVIRRVIDATPHAEEGDSATRKGHQGEGEAEEAAAPVRRAGLLGCPANDDEADELVLLMLAEGLRDEGWDLRVVSWQLPLVKVLAEVDQTPPWALCLGWLPGGPLTPARQFCTRIQAGHRGLPVLLGCWQAQDQERIRQRFTGLVASFAWSLAEARHQLIPLAQARALSAPDEPKPPAPA